MGDGDNQFVASNDANRLINAAKPGQIKNDNCEVAAFAGACDQFFDAIFKTCPIGKAGQTIVHHFATQIGTANRFSSAVDDRCQIEILLRAKPSDTDF